MKHKVEHCEAESLVENPEHRWIGVAKPLYRELTERRECPKSSWDGC